MSNWLYSLNGQTIFQVYTDTGVVAGYSSFPIEAYDAQADKFDMSRKIERTKAEYEAEVYDADHHMKERLR